MRLGIIGSSGGSALIAATECLKRASLPIEYAVITDRPCGMEDWAKENGYAHNRIEYSGAEAFSEKALRYLSSNGCSRALLFYTRRVTFPLISKVDVWNIHPALLPSFRGLHALASFWYLFRAESSAPGFRW